MASEFGICPDAPASSFRIFAEDEYEHCQINDRDYYIKIFAAYLLLLMFGVRYAERTFPVEMLFRVSKSEKYMDIGFPVRKQEAVQCSELCKKAEDMLTVLQGVRFEPFLSYDNDDEKRERFHVAFTYTCNPIRRYGLRAMNKSPLEIEYELLGCMEALLIEIATSVRQ